ncbi:Exo endo phos 2 domain containing protein, partial [Asbolus verrucosus]
MADNKSKQDEEAENEFPTIEMANNNIRNKDLQKQLRPHYHGTGTLGKGKGYAWVETVIGKIYSCYISPNCQINKFQKYLDDLTAEIQSTTDECIIAGEFHSKSPAWGQRASIKEEEYWENGLQAIIYPLETKGKSQHSGEEVENPGSTLLWRRK